jgi:ATP-dependent helicase Lhr and Lhr-like helicase
MRPTDMSFPEQQFHPIIADWFHDRYGEPSPPQRLGWPAIAAGQHTLILAPTGSGKTLAAFMWCIDELFRKSLDGTMPHGIHTLYISPLKALNNDIHRNLQEPLTGIHNAAVSHGLSLPPIRVAVRTGDTTAADRQKLLKKPPHILITTPESLYLLLTSVRGRELFSTLRYIIVDEIHSLSPNKRGMHLCLSLERLNNLCQQEPVRIGLSATQKPLERIAAYLGGQTPDARSDQFVPRPVSIVDCGRRKEMNLSVLSPVEKYGDLPEASVWPAVVSQLYDLISRHRTTLIFVNMRAQSERLARQLNDLHRQKTLDPHAELAFAHHGSMSRESRYDIEARLKKAEIPAVIATASLELGIDIGSIDLVVQVESTKSVSSALQRVGRSGHLLNATSKGILIPLYPADLDDTLALTDCMLRGEIEETIIPENGLDVLAQHIVAETALQTWDRSALFRLVRQSYSFRNLSELTFNRVVDMLAGHFSDEPLVGLQPRLSWDQVNDRLIGRQGSRLLAVMNMGTIPDRGYYAVHLTESRHKLGEVEEEFVFESRVGDHFFLGNNEWRILRIDRNQIEVAPVQAIKPRAPFWKGESLFRDFNTSRRIGAFRSRVLQQADPVQWLMETSHSDQVCAQQLVHYLQKQKSSTGEIPTDKTVVVEDFLDASSIPHLLIHAPFGARVTGAWAMMWTAALEQEYRVEFQYTFDDDGLLFRFPDTLTAPDLKKYFSLPMDKMETLFQQGLAKSPLFSVQFRHNAARALILPRSRPGKRIPLWLQRLRSADLLQTVRTHPDFPILLETYRECMQDLFDWPMLCLVMREIEAGEIRVHWSHTSYPSPMASGLMFRFQAGHLYEYDRLRVPDQAAAVSNELLADLFTREKPPAIITRAMAEESEKRWQHLSHDSKARDAEELWQIIFDFGPLSLHDLVLRSLGDPQEWLKALENDGRIQFLSHEGWQSTLSPSTLSPVERISRFLQHRAPRSFSAIQQGTGLTNEELQTGLQVLTENRQLLNGCLYCENEEPVWCQRDRFAELYRRAIVQRRQLEQAVEWPTLASSLLRFRSRHDPYTLVGYAWPAKSLERDLLCFEPNAIATFANAFGQGEMIAVAMRNSESSRINLTLWPAAQGHLLADRNEILSRADELTDSAKTVWLFLKENGASRLRTITEACSLSTRAALSNLQELASKGLVSCDLYDQFISVLQGEFATEEKTEKPFLPERAFTYRTPLLPRRQIQQQVHLQEAHWFLLTGFAVMGKEISQEQKAEWQARLLLARYGIVVKEAYRRETGLLPWLQIFHALKRLEWQGEIRRGYFVQGMSGIQFTRPEFLRLLQEEADSFSALEIMATIEPICTTLLAATKNLLQHNGKTIDIKRVAGNHLVFCGKTSIVYIEQYGQEITTTDHFQTVHIEALVPIIKRWLQLSDTYRPRKHLGIHHIDDTPAALHPLAIEFIRHGFEKDGDRLLLWPSGV